MLRIEGTRASATPTFSGFADPALAGDPAEPRRLWMAYSYLEGRRAVGARGQAVGVPHVATHLAVSEDGGANWRLHSVLWDSEPVPDPEREGPASFFGSESVGLAVARRGAETIWYSVRLSYFLEPVTAYRPRYDTSWVMRVAAAPTPASLARASDVALGVRTTEDAYGPHVDLNALSPALADCAMWNNPALFAENEVLYLAAECLVFNGRRPDHARSRIVLLRTTPAGAPAQWRWAYVGVLADRALARQLGAERLVSPWLARSRTGALLFIAAPQRGRALTGQGCVAFELVSLDPPRLAGDPAGRARVVARQTARADRGWHTGACAYHAASATGLVTVAATTARGLQAELRTTGLHP